jgi:hypothetical protein
MIPCSYPDVALASCGYGKHAIYSRGMGDIESEGAHMFTRHLPIMASFR